LNIYVGNLPKTTTEEAVRAIFSEYGEVTEVKLIKEKYSNELRGFGFVEMPTRSEALNAIQKVNGFEVEGRSLVVNEAKPRQERSDNYRRSRSW